MRCREARQKIDESKGPIGDKELLEHLRSCPECAGLARAKTVLDRDLTAASEDDIVDGISFAAMKARVESRLELASPDKDKETRIMTRMVRSFNKRPRLGISLALVVVLLAAVALIPFKLSQTIGYEVAIAGVNKDLALDQYRVQELLNALGVDHAEYKVDGCEQTCHLTISDLKDQNEVQLIIEFREPQVIGVIVHVVLESATTTILVTGSHRHADGDTTHWVMHILTQNFQTLVGVATDIKQEAGRDSSGRTAITQDRLPPG